MTRIKTKLQSVITMQRYTYSYRVRHLDNFTNFTNTRASQIAHRIRSHIVQFVETIYILKRFYFSRLKECVSTENSHDPPSSYYYYYYYIYIYFFYIIKGRQSTIKFIVAPFPRLVLSLRLLHEQLPSHILSCVYRRVNNNITILIAHSIMLI